MKEEVNEYRLEHIEKQLQEVKTEFDEFREQVQTKVNMATAIIQTTKFVLYILGALVVFKTPDLLDIAKKVFI